MKIQPFCTVNEVLLISPFNIMMLQSIEFKRVHNIYTYTERKAMHADDNSINIEWMMNRRFHSWLDSILIIFQSHIHLKKSSFEFSKVSKWNVAFSFCHKHDDGIINFIKAVMEQDLKSMFETDEWKPHLKKKLIHSIAFREIYHIRQLWNGSQSVENHLTNMKWKTFYCYLRFHETIWNNERELKCKRFQNYNISQQQQPESDHNIQWWHWKLCC